MGQSTTTQQGEKKDVAKRRAHTWAAGTIAAAEINLQNYSTQHNCSEFRERTLSRYLPLFCCTGFQGSSLHTLSCADAFTRHHDRTGNGNSRCQVFAPLFVSRPCPLYTEGSPGRLSRPPEHPS